MKVAVVDYGMGNIHSVVKALEASGASVSVTNKVLEIEAAERIVLPGVGSFGRGIATLANMGLVEVLNEQVIARKKPFLGICLGMQLAAKEGHEHGINNGLGWIDGRVLCLDRGMKEYRVPHIGWDDVMFSGDSPLFRGIRSPAAFYFVHSYHLVLSDDRIAVVGKCDYGTLFTAAATMDNIHLVQFHPEKSQKNGLRVLMNFLSN